MEFVSTFSVFMASEEFLAVIWSKGIKIIIFFQKIWTDSQLKGLIFLIKET